MDDQFEVMNQKFFMSENKSSIIKIALIYDYRLTNGWIYVYF